MAASSGDGIPAQLAAFLGHPVKQIWIPDETPPRISVIDVATAITGKHVLNATRTLYSCKRSTHKCSKNWATSVFLAKVSEAHP